MYSLRASEAILPDQKRRTQCTGHNSTQIRPQLISKKMRSKRNFQNTYGKQGASKLLPSFFLAFLWRGWTFHLVGLQNFPRTEFRGLILSIQLISFLSQSVGRCFLRARPQLRVLSFSHVTSRVVLANCTIKNSLH